MAIWPHIRCAICRRTCPTRLYTTGAYPLAVTVPPWRSTDGEATVVFGELTLVGVHQLWGIAPTT
ncbi:MAG: hypothetical protein R2867_16440 [Caldilineaceae bacterium]